MRYRYQCLNSTCRFRYIYNYKRETPCPVCGSEKYEVVYYDDKD